MLRQFLNRSGPTPFQNFSITQITNTGRALQAAISPDGKYILNVEDDNGLQSLWLRNVPTGSDTQILAPAAATYASLMFFPDGNYVYFKKAGINTQSECRVTITNKGALIRSAGPFPFRREQKCALISPGCEAMEASAASCRRNFHPLWLSLLRSAL